MPEDNSAIAAASATTGRQGSAKTWFRLLGLLLQPIPELKLIEPIV